MINDKTNFTIAIALGATLCVCMLAIIAFALVFFGVSIFAAGPAISTTAVVRPSTVIPLPTASHAPSGTPSADHPFTADMNLIEQQVIAIRGLSASTPVDRQFMTQAELREYNLKEFAEDYTREEALDDTRTLAVFGLLDPSFELYDFYIDLYSEGILGFYDTDIGKLFIITDRDHFGAVERTTFAHEYMHAIQDQVYGLKALGLSEAGWEEDSEKSAAAQALVEGEATLLEEIWQEGHFTTDDWNDYYENAYADPDSAYYRAPAFLQKDFYFPYSQGYDFVRRLYDRGGWAAINEAYRHPPVSTEMILHPEKYDAGEIPQLVASPVLTDTLGADWRQIDLNVMGEWHTSLVLEQFISEAEAQQAAAGWGGDRYIVSYNDATGQTIAAWHIAWDTPGDAEEFIDAFESYGNNRFGVRATLDNGALCWRVAAPSCLFFSSNATLWILAPDAAMLDKVRQAINFK